MGFFDLPHDEPYHYGGPMDDHREPRHEIADDEHAEWLGYNWRRGQKLICCACSDYWVTIQFDVDAKGRVTITSGPTCGLDYDQLTEIIEAELEPEGPTQSPAEAYHNVW